MVNIIELIIQVLAGFIILITAWGFLPLDYWWVRAVDFPRIQFIVVGCISLFGLCLLAILGLEQSWLLLTGLILALGFQLRMVLPYTRIWKQEVQSAKNDPNAIQLKLMVSNVLTPNKNKSALVNLVKKYAPDILITLESDKKWEAALNQIEPDYPYTVKVPLDNLYGMHLYSKFKLIDPQVKYLLIDDIPSIHTQIQLSETVNVWFYCMHPMPPSPTEAEKSTTRDAELLLVGRHINKHDQMAILAGDLNDVAWSKTTRMFQRISQLLDPRIGRFFINTFHAKYPFLRWALDHVFHSPCFTLVDIKRLPSIGSDHFPVLTTLQFDPRSKREQKDNAPRVTSQDKKEVLEIINEGRKEGRKESAEHESSGDST